MKVCKKCKVEKPLTLYSKCKPNKDGLQHKCKVCAAEESMAYSRTIKGFSAKLYQNQVNRSKIRGHKPPTYSRKELTEYISTDEKFQKLYKEWVDSGYEKDLSPSFDRLDETKGYSFDNIQVVTWEFNNQKQHFARYSHKVKTNLVHKRVTQLTLDGEYVNQFNSCAEAGRITGLSYKNISACTLGKQKSTGGFLWIETKDIND